MLGQSRAPQPQPAPAFELGALEEREEVHTLAEKRGALVVLDFWASGSEEARAHMGETLQPLHTAYANDERLVVISIGTSQEDTREQQRQHAAQQGYEWLMLHDDDEGEIFRAYGVREVPYTVLLDERSRLLLAGPADDVAEPIARYVERRLAAGELAETAGMTPSRPVSVAFVVQLVVFLAVLALAAWMLLPARKSTHGKRAEPTSSASTGDDDASQPTAEPSNHAASADRHA